MDRFQHSRMGPIDPWGQRTSGIARAQFGEQWPAVREQIAGMRAGVPGAAPPAASMAPGYDYKTPEDQRLLLWLIENLIAGGPERGKKGMKGTGASLTGGGVTVEL